MKAMILTAMILAAPIICAQSMSLYECIYQYDINGKTAKGDLSETYCCMLQIGEENSRFIDYAAFQLDSVSAIKGISDETVQEFERRNLNAKHYFDRHISYSGSDATLTVSAPIGLNYYEYEETAPVTDWTFADDSKTVCGYTCRKATGTYGGRNWTVWYTEDIPVPYGPWKFAGLPGLVMKAVDSDSTHRFEAVSFRKGSGTIHRDITVMGESIVVNGIPMRIKEKGFIPLEVPDEKTVKAAAASRSSGGSVRVVGSGSIAK